jgi:hypothetical protein
MWRTLRDLRLTARDCYVPILRTVLDWTSLLGGQRVVLLSVDDTSQAEHVTTCQTALRLSNALQEVDLRSVGWGNWMIRIASKFGRPGRAGLPQNKSDRRQRR